MSETAMTPEQKALVEKVARAMYDAIAASTTSGWLGDYEGYADGETSVDMKIDFLAVAPAVIAVVVEEAAKEFDEPIRALKKAIADSLHAESVNLWKKDLEIIEAAQATIRALAAGKE